MPKLILELLSVYFISRSILENSCKVVDSIFFDL